MVNNMHRIAKNALNALLDLENQFKMAANVKNRPNHTIGESI